MDEEAKQTILYRNIYYILMYAVDELKDARLRDIDIERFEALNNFYASILNTSMLYVLNSGMLQEYKNTSEITDKPKGKIDVPKSILTGGYQRGLLSCSYFKLDINNDGNKVIKLALKILLKYKSDIEKDNVSKLMSIMTYLNKVSDVLPKEVDFGNIELDGLSVEYKTAFYISKLIIEEFITREDGSDRRLIEMEDKDRMNKVFETFVRRYFEVHYRSRNIKVGAKQLGVKNTRNTRYNKSITDITIENKENGRILIVDTKWYKSIFNSRDKVDPANQAQITVYAYQYRAWYGNENTSITSVLLYAKPNVEINIEDIEKELEIEDGVTLNIMVIDLEQEFETITKKLDSIFYKYVI